MKWCYLCRQENFRDAWGVWDTRIRLCPKHAAVDELIKALEEIQGLARVDLFPSVLGLITMEEFALHQHRMIHDIAQAALVKAEGGGG